MHACSGYRRSASVRLGRLIVLGCALAGLAVAPSAASAATVSISGSTLSYAESGNETNSPTVSLTAGEFLITDTTANVAPGAGCLAIDPMSVRCPDTGVTLIDIAGGNQGDSLTVLAPVASTLSGGTGDDTLRGGSQNDTLNGNQSADLLVGGGGADTLTGAQGTDTADYSGVASPVYVDLDGVADDGELNEFDNVASDVEDILGGQGADVLVGSSSANTLNGGDGDDLLDGGLGADALEGGDGDDLLDGGLGADALEGGLGSDEADYSARIAPVTVDNDGLADDGELTELDNVASDVEDISGGAGNDVLVGDVAANRLNGGAGADQLTSAAGNDSIDGGADSDTIDAGSGSDTVTLTDGGPDTADCGDDADTAFADSIDTLVNCEPPDPGGDGGGPPPATDSPVEPPTPVASVTVTAPQLRIRSRRVRVRGRVARVRVECLASPGTRCEGRLTLRSSKGRKLGSRRVSVAPGGSVVKVVLTRRASATLKPGIRLRARAAAIARNPSGVSRRSSRKIVLRR